ncbi:MAG: type II secretion system protein [Candidatus Paceibacterota bacterium]|jgi:prepilin-type N-terminal cleavage/methylation domain-containing protein
MKSKFFKNKNTGYTLIETLVALSIFSISILGILVTLSQSVADTSYAQKKVVAAYLAQEGIEYVRNLRDTYMIYNTNNPKTGWSDFTSRLLTDGCDIGCYFDPAELVFTDETQPMLDLGIYPCDAEICPNYLVYNQTTGEYGYSALGENTGLRRTIRAEQVNANEEKITSIVSWEQGSGSYSVELSDNLFNWIE